MTLTMNSRAVPVLSRYEVNEITGCWLWIGYVNKDGYARADAQNAHRVFYEHHIGPVPAGYDVDHLCKRRNCVNPEHLEAVSERENLRRTRPVIKLSGREFDICRKGHLIRGANIQIQRRKGREYKRCYLCYREHRGAAGMYARSKAALADAVLGVGRDAA